MQSEMSEESHLPTASSTQVAETVVAGMHGGPPNSSQSILLSWPLLVTISDFCPDSTGMIPILHFRLIHPSGQGLPAEEPLTDEAEIENSTILDSAYSFGRAATIVDSATAHTDETGQRHEDFLSLVGMTIDQVLSKLSILKTRPCEDPAFRLTVHSRKRVRGQNGRDIFSKILNNGHPTPDDDYYPPEFQTVEERANQLLHGVVYSPTHGGSIIVDVSYATSENLAKAHEQAKEMVPDENWSKAGLSTWASLKNFLYDQKILDARRRREMESQRPGRF